MKLTGVVLTCDEASMIGGCLASLRAVTDDVLVLDAFSRDETPEIARSCGARVVQRAWEGFPAARNAGLTLAGTSDWVLFVDADERVPASLASEIQAQVSNANTSVDGFWLARKNVICGRVMRGGGWWPDYQLRLLRTGRCHYPDHLAVHETAMCAGSTLALNTPLVHLNYSGWGEFATKQIAFARLAANASPQPGWRSYLGAPGRAFLERFVTQRGYLDGRTGLTAAALLSASESYRVWLARQKNS